MRPIDRLAIALLLVIGSLSGLAFLAKFDWRLELLTHWRVNSSAWRLFLGSPATIPDCGTRDSGDLRKRKCHCAESSEEAPKSGKCGEVRTVSGSPGERSLSE
jgi:hypothetical protein